MNIEVDYNPSTGKESFFISVELNKGEALSFDYTTKGHRIMKQVLIKKEPHKKAIEKYGKEDGGWDAIWIVNGKFKKMIHYDWVDQDKIDIVSRGK